jgi:hypothetical protein
MRSCNFIKQSFAYSSLLYAIKCCNGVGGTAVFIFNLGEVSDWEVKVQITIKMSTCRIW